MSGKKHSALTGDTLEGIHIINQFTYADESARTGASGFVAADVGKVAKQTDDLTYWVLTATTPTWKELTPSAPTHTHTESDITDLHSRPVQSTESLLGIAEIATQAETDTGTDDLKIVTPLKLKNATVGLISKADAVAGASFSTVSGEKIFDVVFSAAYADTNYTVTVLSTAQRIWRYSTKVTTGFRIHAQSNSDLTGDTIDWQTIKNGES